MSVTDNYGYILPAAGSHDWGGASGAAAVNQNFIDIDAQIAALEAGGGGGGGPFAPDASLENSVSRGGTSFNVSGSAPSGMFAGRHIMLTIDAGTDLAETVTVQSLSGSTFGIRTASKPHVGFFRAHSVGAPIVWHRHNLVPAWAYNVRPGVDGNGDWARLQRMQLDLYRSEGIAWGGNYRTQTSFRLTQPLCLMNSTLMLNWSFGHDAAWSAGGGVGDLFTLPWSRNIAEFTASASTDRVTFTTSPLELVPSSGKAVTLNDPESAGFPGNVVQGKTYYMKNVSGGNSFQLSTLSDLSDTVDITSDGAGWAYGNYTSLTKAYAEKIYLQAGIADVGGIYVSAEQPSIIRDLNLEMDIAATSYGNAVGLSVGGLLVNGVRSSIQWMNFDNIEINPATNVIGYRGYGSGIKFTGITTMNAQGQAMELHGNQHLYDGFLLERCHHPRAIHFTSASDMRGVELGYLQISAEDSIDPILEDESGATAGGWAIAGGACATTSAKLLKNDAAYGELFSWDGNTPGTGITEESKQTFGRIEHPSLSSSLVFHRRRTQTVSANWTFRQCFDTILVHSSSKTGTLHTPVGFDGLTYNVVPEPGVTGTTVANGGFTLLDATGASQSSVPVPAGGLRLKAMAETWKVLS